MQNPILLNRKHYIVSLLSLALVVLGLVLTAPNPASANIQFFDGQDTCTGTNCLSQSYVGLYERNSNNSQAIPFTIQIYSSGAECLRLDVTSQGVDLEMVLVGPEGSVWRNDDRSSDTRPLIKVSQTPVDGWYTLQVSEFDASPPASLIGLRYGRYNTGNPNCNNPTPQLQ